MQTRFAYQANTQDGRAIAGIIAAESPELARKSLSRLGYTIMTMTVAPAETSRVSNKRTFSFEAFNKQGKKILGTISTSDPETARTKLASQHGLTIAKLTDITPGSTLDNTETNTLKEEAQAVIAKAEEMLEQMGLYDPDYNNVFDAKEEVRYMLKDGNIKGVGGKIAALLALLQSKETASIVTEKTEVESGVKKEMENLISSIRVETEETRKTPANFYFNTVLSEIQTLSSWLLVFYAIYFILAELMAEKNVSFLALDFLRNTLFSSLLFKITVAVILVHVFCRVKLFFLEKNLLSGILLGVLIFILSLWVFMI